jgi:DNA-binding beta-propeller fold protein YncE
MRPTTSATLATAAFLVAVGLSVRTPAQPSKEGGVPVPRFEVDLSWQWPPTLPNNWVVGVVSWVAVDRRDHVWVMHRPRQVPAGRTDRAAPAVLEFDAGGRLVQGWGGPGEGYDWPDMEHGLSVDHQDNVWITGLNPLERSYSAPSQRTDDMIVKFTSKGTFIRQFGGRDRHPLAEGGNADTTSVHLATEAVVHPKTRELFVADGYANRRLLVLDAETLTFKRMWGAFGRQPPPTLGRGVASKDLNRAATTAAKGPDVFNTVHAVRVSNDGLVYVADRNYRRIQVFTLDGQYLDQVLVNPSGADYMTACGLAFSPDAQQRFIYVGDYGNGHVHIIDRKALRQIASFGSLSGKPGDFRGLHALAVDSKGNLWTAETQPRPTGSRVQRFIFKGVS